MKKVLLILLLFTSLFPINLQAQNLLDAQWIVGEDSTQSQIGGGTLIDFKMSSPSVIDAMTTVSIRQANTSMCDSLGNLIFYSNGCRILNKEHETMENGDTLSSGIIMSSYCDSDYSPISGSVLALPSPIPHQYYLLSYRSEAISSVTGDSATIMPRELLLNIIDITQNNGLGKVIKRNKIMIADTLGGGYLQATKHANGQDWWVVSPEFSSNCYYVMHLTPLGVASVKKECLGEGYDFFDLTGQAVFSPDGTKYARLHNNRGINIFDFDRCLGTFSNAISLSNLDTLTTARGGIAISQNSKILYAFSVSKLFQYDLEAMNIAESKIFIAEYDGFSNPYPTYYYKARLAMDGKIYVGCPGTSNYFHIIHQPDSIGIICDFQQHGLQLASYNHNSMPNLAHYRLGATTTPCYPLSTIYNIDSIECHGDSTAALEIYTSSGTPPYTYSWSDISLSGHQQNNLPAGIYDVTVTDALDSVSIISIEIPQPAEALSTTTTSEPEVGASQNGMASVQVTGGTPPYHYLWKKDTVILQTESAISGLSAGLYEIIITDANGCSISEIVEIEQTSSSSLPTGNLTFFNITPNPSHGTTLLELSVKSPSELSVKIITVTGKLNQVICKNKKVEKRISIPIKNLSKGVYFVVVKTGERTQVEKIIVL